MSGQGSEQTVLIFHLRLRSTTLNGTGRHSKYNFKRLIGQFYHGEKYRIVPLHTLTFTSKVPVVKTIIVLRI